MVEQLLESEKIIDDSIPLFVTNNSLRLRTLNPIIREIYQAERERYLKLNDSNYNDVRYSDGSHTDWAQKS